MDHLELNYITPVQEISHKIIDCGFNLSVLTLFIVIPVNNTVTLVKNIMKTARGPYEKFSANKKYSEGTDN